MALPCRTAWHCLHRRDYCFSACATVGLNSRRLGVVCLRISSELRLLFSLFPRLSSAPLATSGGAEASCRGKTRDRRRLYPSRRTLAPVRIVALLALPRLDFSTVLYEGHPLVCIPVVSSTPPSSPSSPGAIRTKQLPALSPLPPSPVHFLRRLCKQSLRICGSGISFNSTDEGASGGDWGRDIGEKRGWIKQTRGGGFTQLASSCTLSRRSEKGYVYKQLGAQPPILGERAALCHCRRKKQWASPALLDPIQLYATPFSHLLSWLFSTVESTRSRQWPSAYRGLVNHFRSVLSLAFHWSYSAH